MAGSTARGDPRTSGNGKLQMVAGSLMFVGVVAVATIVALRLLTGTEDIVRDRLAEALGGNGGLRIETVERIAGGLSPVYRFSGVAVETARGLPWLTVDQADIAVDQLESVVGAPTLRSIVLTRPAVRPDLLAEAVIASPDRLTDDFIAVEVRDGSIVGGGRLQDIDLTLRVDPDGVRGRGVGVLGEWPVDLSVDTLGGAPALTARSAGQSLRFRDPGNGRPWTARVEIDEPSALERWADDLGVPVPDGALRALRTDRLVVEGVPVTLANGRGWGLRAAWLELAGTIMTGGLEVDDRDGLPRLRGALETEQLDLARLVATAGGLTTGWNAERLAGWIGDLSIQAAALDVLGTRLEDVPIRLRVENVSAFLTVGPAWMGGGQVLIQLTATQAQGLPRLGIAVQAQRVPVWTMPLLARLAGGTRGQVSGRLSVTASGERAETLLASAIGQGELTITDGAFGSLVQARGGQGGFGSFETRVEIDRGVVTLVDLMIDDSIGAGWLDLTQEQLAVRLVDPARGTVDLTGAWASPTVTLR